MAKIHSVFAFEYETKEEIKGALTYTIKLIMTVEFFIYSFSLGYKHKKKRSAEEKEKQSVVIWSQMSNSYFRINVMRPLLKLHNFGAF